MKLLIGQYYLFSLSLIPVKPVFGRCSACSFDSSIAERMHAELFEGFFKDFFINQSFKSISQGKIIVLSDTAIFHYLEATFLYAFFAC